MQLRAHERKMVLPGVIPNSEKYLEQEDTEGNQLWRVTCMKDTVSEYSKILKKSGFHCQEFNFDQDQYVANKNLESQLKQDMRSTNEQLLSKSNHNFQELF